MKVGKSNEPRTSCSMRTKEYEVLLLFTIPHLLRGTNISIICFTKNKRTTKIKKYKNVSHHICKKN